MIGAGEAAGSLGKPAFAGRRLRHHSADFTTKLAFDPVSENDFAGLLAFMDESHFLTAGIEGKRFVVRLRTDAEQDQRGELVAEQPLVTDEPVELKLALRGGEAQVFWRIAGQGGWQDIGGAINVEPLASIHAGLFTGLVVGPYAYSQP